MADEIPKPSICRMVVVRYYVGFSSAEALPAVVRHVLDDGRINCAVFDEAEDGGAFVRIETCEHESKADGAAYGYYWSWPPRTNAPSGMRATPFVPKRCGLVAEGPPGVLGNTTCVLPRGHEGACSIEEW